MSVPTIGPAPQFPERAPQMYDRKFSPAVPGQEGPLRFQEGVATDTAAEMRIVIQGAVNLAENDFLL